MGYQNQMRLNRNDKLETEIEGNNLDNGDGNNSEGGNNILPDQMDEIWKDLP